MSWTLQMIGKPEKVAAAIEKHGENLTGQSREEWEEAKPALLTLVRGNIGPCAVRVTASGHATIQDGKKTYGACTCNIEQFYGLVE